MIRHHTIKGGGWHIPEINPILYIFHKDSKEDSVRGKGVNTGEATSAPSLNQTSPPSFRSSPLSIGTGLYKHQMNSMINDESNQACSCLYYVCFVLSELGMSKLCSDTYIVRSLLFLVFFLLKKTNF